MNETGHANEHQRISVQARNEKSIRFMKGLFCGFLLIQILVVVFRPLTDPSECRYANLAANMASSGNFIEPIYVYDGVLQCFQGKPPLFFQAGGMSCRLFGKNAFAVRFPSLVFSLLTVGFVFAAVRKASDRKTAWVAALLCFLNPLFYVYSGLCATDMMLTCFIVGGVLAYANFSDSQCAARIKLHSLMFFMFLALGMMVKGPVAIVGIGFPVFLFVAICRKWGELRHHAWFFGPLVFALIVLPWFFVMNRLHPEFLKYFFYNENFGRFILKEYGDKFGSGHDSFRGVAFLLSIAVNLTVIIPLMKLVFADRLSLEGIKGRVFEGISLIAALALTAFWCPTNRVPVAYLLPTVPFFAIFTALKLADAEYVNDDALMRLSLKVGVGAGFVAACVLVFLALFSAQVTTKMPAEFYKRVLVRERETGRRVNAGYYFLGRTPHSAEFYLGDRVRNHPDEYSGESLTNSMPYFLMVTDRNLAKLGQPPDRELILEHGKWNMFAPEKREAR